MNEPIDVSEIVEPIKNQKRGKTPGPDGLPVGYSRNFEECILLPYKSIGQNIRGRCYT